MNRCLTAALAGLSVLTAAIGAAPVLDFSQAQIEYGFTPGPNAGSNPVELRLDLTPGTTWTETIQMGMTHSMEMPQMPNTPGMPSMNNEMQMTMAMQNTALAGSTEGSHQIQSTVQDASMTMMVNGQPMDSGMMGGNPLASMHGQTTTVEVDDRGMPSNFQETMQQMMGGGGMQQSGQSPMMSQVCLLPDRPVSVGDSWTMTMTFPSVPDASMVQTNTLQSVESSGDDQIAVIGSQTHFAVPTPVAPAMGSAAVMPGTTIESMDMTADATVRHNVTQQHRGNAEGTFNMQMSMGMDVPNPQGGAPMSHDMGMTMSGTMETTVEYQ